MRDTEGCIEVASRLTTRYCKCDMPNCIKNHGEEAEAGKEASSTSHDLESANVKNNDENRLLSLTIFICFFFLDFKIYIVLHRKNGSIDSPTVGTRHTKENNLL